MVAPPPDEADRLAALRRYDGPDSDPELDEIAALAAESIGVPIAKVALVDADRLAIRGTAGDELREVPRDIAFSAHALQHDGIFEVQDAAHDPRFADNPQVIGAPGIRFYAGSPLKTADGHRLGVLCVIDRYPRCLSPRERSTLVRLARLAMARLELLHANRQLETERSNLTQQRAFLDRAMDTALEGILVQTPDGRIRHCNKAAAALLGRSRDEVVGQYLWDVSAPPRFLDRAKRDFSAFVARAGEPGPVGARRSLVAQRGDGSEIHIEAASTLHNGFLGLEVITFFHDISHHKELERLHHQLDDLVKAFPESFNYYDADDRLVLGNAQLRDKMGMESLQPQDHVGKRFEDVLRDVVSHGVYADALGREDAWIEERLAVHRSYGTMELRLTNGRCLRLVQRRTNDGGRICVYIDITEMKRRREELEVALVQAEAAAEAKSEFIATMSHEIRTPLNALIGLSDVLMESTLDPNQRTWVQTMQASGRHLLQLVNDVLDFSALQSRRVTLADEAFELRPAIDELMATAAALPGAARLALETRLADDVPAAIRGDRHRLLQVLTNLVGNAVKFTPVGRVRLAGWTEAGADGPTLCLEVADSGPGIPAALADRIFEDFVQADTPGQPLRTGTGLGLAIARRLAEAMGGTLAVANPGEPGARFLLRLPCRPADVPAPAAAPAIARSKVARRVLVAEDTPASQMVIRLLLEGLGHAVEIVDTGPAALAAFETGDFDTVLLDLQLPGMDGCSVAQAIRLHEAETAAARRATLVAVSAFSQPRDRERALAAGMDSYLAKPVRLRDLAALFDSLDRTTA